MKVKEKSRAVSESTSQGAVIWSELKKNKGAMVGLVIMILIGLVAIFADVLFDYETQVVNMDIANRLQSPSAAHLMGTDSYGRDVLIRVLYGARPSLLVGIVSVFIALLLGTSLGVVAGYYGKRLEDIIMRVCDVFASIPAMLLAICITAALGQGLFVLMLAIGVTSIPNFARIARASVMTVRDQEYIEAARASGAKDIQIILSHIIPNSLAPIVVQATMRVASAIIMASALSFLGLGIPAPAPEWGGMLSEGRNLIRDYSYMTLFPGAAIMVTVLAINLLGDGLRDAMDPKLKS